MEENELRPEPSGRIQAENGSSESGYVRTGTIGTNDGREPATRMVTEELTEESMSNSSKHNITIHSLDFGYNVKIGCQNFAVESVEKLIKNLEAYLNEPRTTERKWMDKKELL